VAAALGRLQAADRSGMPVGEALLDQRALAGLGNVYRSELCFLERVDPFLPVGQVDPAILERLVRTGARLLNANRSRPDRTTTGVRRDGDRLWVYGRTGRPCRRCGTPIRSVLTGTLPRRVWWCPGCQPPGAGAAGSGAAGSGAAGSGADPGSGPAVVADPAGATDRPSEERV